MSDESQHEYRDHSGWIKICGAPLVFLGSICLFCPLLVLVHQTTRPESTLEFGLIDGAHVIIMGTILFAVGAGLVKLRRWAGDVALALSIAALVFGAFALLVAGTGLAGMAKGDPNGEPVETGSAVGRMISMSCCFSVLFLSWPGAMVYFFSRPSVRWTFRQRDPDPTWTDSCPMPVLWFSLALLLMSPFAVRTRPVPVCGIVLRDWSIMAYSAALGGSYLVAGWLLYKRKMAGWWLALLLHLLPAASGVLNALFVEYTEVWQGSTPEQMAKAARLAPSWKLGHWLSAAFSLALVGYLIYMLRFFRQRKEPPQAEESQANS